MSRLGDRMGAHRLARLAALVALAVCAADRASAQTPRWGAGYIPNPEVVSQDGKTLRFYDDLIKGKVVVISFMFTSCPDLCPLTTARLTQVEDKLGDAIGRDVFFISLSIDPENDTPEKLKAYAQAFGTGPGWTFVTGKPDALRAILHKFGERSRKLSEHRNEVVLGNEATGQWMRNSAFSDLDRLVMDIRGMDPKWREQVRSVPRNAASDTGYQLSDKPGQALFTKLCAPCHTIAVGDRVGPDLYGAAERRTESWLARYIRNPDQMRAQKDPAALALVAQFPGVRMPALGLAEHDAADLVAYIKAETARLAVADAPAAPSRRQHQHRH